MNNDLTWREEFSSLLRKKIHGCLQAIQVEIRRLDSRIDSLKSEMTAEISSQKTVLAAEIRRLDEKVDRIDERIDTAMQIRERLATVEAKLAAMER